MRQSFPIQSIGINLSNLRGSCGGSRTLEPLNTLIGDQLEG